MAFMTSTLAATVLAQGPHALHASRKSASAVSPVAASSAKRNATHHKAEEAEVASTSAAHAANDDDKGAKGDGAKGESGKAETKAAKTRTYTFGALDVEGKMKTPQLLYFLNRVKLELEMSAPDKKSFMKDLERSADDSSL